jgi:DNA mismatch endonuclease (patch repair protein)
MANARSNTLDRISAAERSAQMSRIRGTNTQPELFLRRLLRLGGYRYLLHVASLPGRPDVVFKSRKKVIFVHGCFWHQHSGCKDASLPKSRTVFWQQKLQRNVERDEEQRRKLVSMGWKVMTVWECELSDPSLRRRLIRFLGPAEARQLSRVKA